MFQGLELDFPLIMMIIGIMGLIIGVAGILVGLWSRKRPRTISGTCAWCEGTGRDFSAGYVVKKYAPFIRRLCPSCGGKGSLILESKDKCGWCNGSGREPRNPRRRCHICGGTGWAHVLRE